MAEAYMRYPTGHEVPVASAAAALVSGQVVQAAGLGGIVAGLDAIEIGDPYTVQVKGIVEVTSASATTFAEGDAVQWDDTGKVAVATGDFALGKAARAKANGETSVMVILNE